MYLSPNICMNQSLPHILQSLQSYVYLVIGMLNLLVSYRLSSRPVESRQLSLNLIDYTFNILSLSMRCRDHGQFSPFD